MVWFYGAINDLPILWFAIYPGVTVKATVLLLQYYYLKCEPRSNDDYYQQTFPKILD